MDNSIVDPLITPGRHATGKVYLCFFFVVAIVVSSLKSGHLNDSNYLAMPRSIISSAFYWPCCLRPGHMCFLVLLMHTISLG